MKRKFFASLLSLTIVFATSCSKSSNSTPANAAVVASQSAVSGTWRVSSFINSGTNETAAFAGYSFVFSGATVTATKNGIITNGAWSVNTSSVKFIIDLGPRGSSNIPLGELTDDWRITSANDTQIQLQDDSNVEFVTFTKN
jgi:hypothetical protein